MYALAWMDGSFPWTQLMYIFQFFFSLSNQEQNREQGPILYTALHWNKNESVLWVCHPTRPKDWYRQTLFYALSLCCTLQILCLQTKRFVANWRVASLSVPFFQWHLLSLCLFLVLLTISKPSNNKKKMMTCWRLRWWLESFSNKVFFKLRNIDYFRQRQLHIIDYSVITVTCTGKHINPCDPLYCATHCTGVVWNQTYIISEVCLYRQF